MPKLTGVVDSLESIPEAYRASYEEKDGKFHLKEIEFEDSATVKEKLGKKEQALNAANQKLGRYGKFQELTDDELEETLTLRELKKAGKPLTVDEKAELERLNKKATDKLTSELNAEREGRKAEQAQLKKFKLTDPIRSIATSEAVGMFAEDFDLAWSEIGSRFKLVEEEGKKPRIVVLDDDGDETDIKVEDFFVKLYRQKRPKFFKASDAGGSGAVNEKKGGGGGKTINRAAFDQMDPNEKSKFISEGGKVTD